MSTITNNTIHTKYEKDWKDEIEQMSLLISKEKKEEVKNYLVERTKLNQEKKDLITEKRKLEDEKKGLKSVYAASRYLTNQKTELENNKTAGDNLDNKWNQFANSTGGAWNNGTANGYTANEGWNAAIQKHYPATYKNNLYEFKNGSVKEELTEEQVINTVARTVKALEKVNTDDFLAKYNAKESDTTKQNQVKTYLKEIQDQAPYIIVGSDKDAEKNPKPRTYDFADTYQKFDEKTNAWTAYAAPAFNYQNFFAFIKLVQGQEFLNNLDTDKQKEVPASENWKVFLKDEEWKPEELADYGIILADKTKTTLYKTGSEFREFKVNQGIKGWIELANTITSDDNQTKITASFVNSPQQKLVNDLKTWNFSHGTLQNANYALGNPDTLIENAEDILDELDKKKISNALLDNELTKQIKTKQTEITAKQTELKSKETEINKIVQEILTKKREELKKHNLEKGFKKDDNNDNRRDLTKLYIIKQLLLEIRYLENNGDTTQLSSQDQENNALTEITAILGDCDKYRLVDRFQSLAYVSGGDGKYDNQQAITRIKAGKYTDREGQEHQIYESLEKYQEHFKQKAELVKLYDWELQALKAIEIELGKEKDETEKLSDWQTKLKSLDATLDEKVITEEVMKDWQTQTNFKTLAKMEAEIKKIIKDGKLNEDFKKVMEKEDSELVDLPNLFKKKKAQEIITLIRRWEYDKETNNSKKERLAKVIKINMDKKKEDNITEEEITTGLYKLAVGEYSQKSDSEIKKWEEGEKEEGNNNENTESETNFFRLNNPWMWGGMAAIVGIIGLGIWYYFNQSSQKKEGNSEREIDSEENEE